MRSAVITIIITTSSSFAGAQSSAVRSGIDWDSPAPTIKSPAVAEPGENLNSRPPFEFGSSLIFETYGSVDSTSAQAIGNNFTFSPTLGYTPWDLALAIEANYSKQYSVDPQTDAVPEGSFDNHLVSVTKKLDARFSVGVSGTIPANQTARDLTFQGSAGPFMKFESAYRRFDFKQTLNYRLRSFETEDLGEGALNLKHAWASVTELSYRIRENVSVSTAITVVAASNFSSRTSYGERSQLSVNYKPQDLLTTSCGLSHETGLAVIDGASENKNLEQAYLDIILDI